MFYTFFRIKLDHIGSNLIRLDQIEKNLLKNDMVLTKRHGREKHGRDKHGLDKLGTPPRIDLLCMKN